MQQDIEKRNKHSMLAVEIEEMQHLGNEELKQRLAESLRITTEQLVRLAAIVHILEERGEDLSELRLGLLGYLRRIAHGQMLPELVISFQGYPMLLSRAAVLPLPDQRRIISGEPFKVISHVDGKASHRLVEPLRMCRQEIQQVFAKDHIRDEGEQVSYLREHRGPRTTSKSSIEVDAKRRGIIVSGEGVLITRAQLITLLARITD